MERNAIESDFRSSKMAAGSHFVKKNHKKLSIDLKWQEMRLKVIFGASKMAAKSYFVNKILKLEYFDPK